MSKKHKNHKEIKVWIDNANEKMKKLKKDEEGEGDPSEKDGKIRITWKVNPQQTVEVEPGVGETNFEIFDYDEY